MNDEKGMTLFDLDTFLSREEVVKEEQTSIPPAQDTNPCIARYGPSSVEGQTCKGCLHLRYPHGGNPNKRFWKCDLRTLTHGRATDHKVTWPACARYERRVGDYHGG